MKRLSILGAVLLSLPAWAHSVGLSRGTYRVEGRQVEAELTFARSELVAVVPNLDRDSNGEVTPEELSTSASQLESRLVQAIELGEGCQGSLREASLTQADGLTLSANYVCPSASAKLEVAGLLSALPRGHRHLARLERKAAVSEDVLFEAQTSIAGEGSDSSAGLASSMWAMGVKHILSGFDHLLFLFGLVLVGRGLGSMLKVVTAFTVAHSVTLSAGALGLWAPSPSWVEPLIALSIAYVGVENLFIKNPDNRWKLTFPFGLIHGFGFAGALQEISLPPGQLPVALLSFNLGVEVGQLAVMALVLPLIVLARRVPLFQRYGVQALSGLLIVPGLFWFVQRMN